MEITLIFKIAGIGILCACIVSVLKQSGRDEFGTMASIAGIVIVLMLVVNVISELFTSLRTLFNLY